MTTTTDWNIHPSATNSTPPNTARPGPLGRLGGVAYRNRGKVVMAWLLAIGAPLCSLRDDSHAPTDS